MRQILKLWMLAAILYICGNVPVCAQTAADTVYVYKQDQADAGYFLPAPPDTASMDYVDDLVQWQWGKTVRSTARGRQASKESWWTTNAMRIVMAEALQIDTISATETPALERLLVKSYWTGEQSTAAAKEKYMRTRPFIQMNDTTWGEYDDYEFLRGNGSYPSGHTSFAWATALVFAEMWPELQDTILRRGFQFGESRVIVGAHYQSDVNAGYLCGAASIAHAHRNPLLEQDILAARAEYAQLKGLPADYDPTQGVELPHGEKILNLPVDTASYRYLAELMRYWNAKTLRPTERGLQAVEDVDNTVEGLVATFGKALDIEISESATPAIWQLISRVRTDSKAIAAALKSTNFRKRPYVQLGETTPVPWKEEEERTESSFASGHSCLGWAAALVLAEMAPDRQDEILKRGYDYGYSRLIVGYHWATDIEAARLLACALVARQHADADFRALIEKAREEYQQSTGIQEVVDWPDSQSDNLPNREAIQPTNAYRLDGIRATRATQGIVVQNGKKAIVRHQ